MGGFFAELKRRQMFRVAAAYAVVAWLLLQIVNNVAPILDLPVWVARAFLLALVIGFPIALLFVWMRDLAPSDALAPKASASRIDYALIGALVLVIALVSYQQIAPSTGGRAPEQQQPGVISIAVLPLANLSGDAAQEFFSDGMTDEITSALAKVRDLRIVGRSSAFQFKGQNRDLRAIGQALGARYLIDGSVRKEGNRVRISAQLVQADNGVGVWTNSYDRELTGLFATQEDIATAIAGALRVPLGLQQGESLISNRTDDVDSYQQYLRARSLIRARAIDEAIALLEPVVTRDPRYAPAWGLLARAYGLVATYRPELRSGSLDVARPFVQAMLAKGDNAAQQAIQLYSQNAYAYAALAYLAALHRNWSAAEDYSNKALALDPNDPEVLQTAGTILATVGRFKDSLEIRLKLLTLEPFVPVYNINTAEIMQYNGQVQAGIPILERIPADAAGGYQRNLMLAQAYSAVGRYAD